MTWTRRLLLGVYVAVIAGSASAQPIARVDTTEEGWREVLCGLVCGLGATACCLEYPVFCEICVGGGVGCYDICVDFLDGCEEPEPGMPVAPC